MKKTIIAAFDFDGTLTKRDSLPSFFRYTFGDFKTALYFTLEIPTLLGFLCGLKSRQHTKEKILKRFLGRLTIDEIREKGEAFATRRLNDLVKKEGFQRIQWHLNQGHQCILVSANLDVYLKPWSENQGFHAALCSQVALGGKLQGLNCWGPEKVRRLIEHLGPKEGYELYAYGDSRGDRELLELADHAFFRTLK